MVTTLLSSPVSPSAPFLSLPNDILTHFLFLFVSPLRISLFPSLSLYLPVTTQTRTPASSFYFDRKPLSAPTRDRLPKGPPLLFFFSLSLSTADEMGAATSKRRDERATPPPPRSVSPFDQSTAPSVVTVLCLEVGNPEEAQQRVGEMIEKYSAGKMLSVSKGDISGRRLELSPATTIDEVNRLLARLHYKASAKTGATSTSAMATTAAPAAPAAVAVDSEPTSSCNVHVFALRNPRGAMRRENTDELLLILPREMTLGAIVDSANIFKLQPPQKGQNPLSVCSRHGPQVTGGSGEDAITYSGESLCSAMTFSTASTMLVLLYTWESEYGASTATW